MGSIVTETVCDAELGQQPELDRPRLAKPIVHVVAAGEFGGAEAQILALLTELQRRRAHVVVVTYYEGIFAQRVRALGIPLHILRTRTPWGDFRQLLAVCRTAGAGLLHTHGVRASIAGRLAGRLVGAPVVTTVHSDLYYDYASPVKRMAFMWLEAMTRRLSQRVVAVSEALAGTLLERGYRRERLTVIHNALDVTAADAEIARAREAPLHLRRHLGLPDHAYVVMCVARLHAVKRQDVLIEAMALLPEANGRPTHLVLAGARAPVSFFAYPDKPSDPVPPGCAVVELAGAGLDVVAALEALADALGAPAIAGRRHRGRAGRPERPSGRLTPESMALAVGHLLPEGAIVVDESITSGLSVPGTTAGGPRHEWLALAGGSIGQGLPVATGAAVAAPGRRVLSLEADGSAMYTIQSLWTQAREGLDVTTVVLVNRSYAILQLELARVGASGTGEGASAMLDLGHPPLDFVEIARGMGVPSDRATSADELADLLEKSFSEDGPALIEAVFG